MAEDPTLGNSFSNALGSTGEEERRRLRRRDELTRCLVGETEDGDDDLRRDF